jgi:LmbE family N-acetylglucosaminyl deacetylase
MAEGVTSRSPGRDRRGNTKALTRLADCARRAAKVLGAESVTLEQFPDNRLDSVDLLDLIKTVERYVTKLQPRTVYTHHGGDLNVDHQKVHEAVATACRPLPGASVRRLFLFEVPSSTEWQLPGSQEPFVPGTFVDVSATLSRKVKALQCYAPEMREFPHPRSTRAVEHLAHWRGASAGVDAAEAFVVGREIIS